MPDPLTYWLVIATNHLNVILWRHPCYHCTWGWWWHSLQYQWSVKIFMINNGKHPKAIDLALVFLASQKALSLERSGLIKSEGPGISGSQLNTLCYAASILRTGALRMRASCQKPWGWAKQPRLKANAVPTLFEKPALLKRTIPAVESQPKKKTSLWEMWEIEGKIALHIPKSLALGYFPPPTLCAVISRVPVWRMTFRWFVAMTNHYVSGLFDSSGICLYQSQRVSDWCVHLSWYCKSWCHDSVLPFNKENWLVSIHTG